MVRVSIGGSRVVEVDDERFGDWQVLARLTSTFLACRSAYADSERDGPWPFRLSSGRLDEFTHLDMLCLARSGNDESVLLLSPVDGEQPVPVAVAHGVVTLRDGRIIADQFGSFPIASLIVDWPLTRSWSQWQSARTWHRLHGLLARGARRGGALAQAIEVGAAESWAD